MTATGTAPPSVELVEGHVRAGQFAEAVRLLRDRSYAELRASPQLALFFGIALARLGRHLEGRHWARIALAGAREMMMHWVEARALNVCGALAMEAGELDEAQEHLLRARDIAAETQDHATTGRCSNNLGIIAAQRGEYGRAVGTYTLAVAAYERAGQVHGVSETYHNLGIAYRDNGRFDEAREAGNRAVTAARTADDRCLMARAMAGRAETLLAAGDAAQARSDVERALALHRELGALVDQAEDLRILGLALAAADEIDAAEATLRDAVTRARRLQRPLLHAAARRDLARLLLERGRNDEARDVARVAQRQFEDMGAQVEVQRLEDLLTDIGCPVVRWPRV